MGLERCERKVRGAPSVLGSALGILDTSWHLIFILALKVGNYYLHFPEEKTEH